MALLEHLGQAALGEEISHIRRISHPRRLFPLTRILPRIWAA